MSTPAPRYRFGQFVLDVAEQRLCRDDVPLDLPPQPLRVLQVLVERAGRLVTRDDLRREVWGDRFVAFDQGLNFCIRRIRAALNDPVRNPVYIETARGRGYRFIAPVADERRHDPAIPVERDRPRRPTLGRGWRAAAAVASLALPLLVAFLLARDGGPRAAHDAPPLVLVLDFAADGQDVPPRLGRELGAAVAARLARTTPLRVVQRSAPPGDAAEVGRRLRADFILVGAAQHARGGVAVHVELVRVRDAQTIWSDHYAPSDSTPKALLGTVAARVSGTAGALLADAVGSGPAAVDDLEALDRFLRANEYIERLGYHDLAAARELYAQASAMDSAFAAAYARESWVLSWLAWLYADTAGLARAESLARRATVLAPRSLDAGIARALLRYGRRDYVPTLAIIDSVLRRAPDHGLAIGIKGWVLRRQGRWEEALEHLHRSFTLTPTYDAAVTLAEAHAFLRSYSSSLRYWERAIAIDPAQPLGYSGTALVHLLWRGDTAAAATVIRESAARGVPIEFTLLLAPRPVVRALAGSFADVARRSFPLDFHGRATVLTAQGDMLAAIGDSTAARERYREARDLLDPAIGTRMGAVVWIGLGSDEGRLANVAAALGDRRAAREAAIRTERSLPLDRDHVEGVRRRLDIVESMVRLADHESALPLLESLLSMPAPVSRELLAVDPLWIPLRDHPGVVTLVDRPMAFIRGAERPAASDR